VNHDLSFSVRDFTKFTVFSLYVDLRYSSQFGISSRTSCSNAAAISSGL
jgi:hypothetical protein